jgi:hypothetical protein
MWHNPIGEWNRMAGDLAFCPRLPSLRNGGVWHYQSCYRANVTQGWESDKAGKVTVQVTHLFLQTSGISRIDGVNVIIARE